MGDSNNEISTGNESLKLPDNFPKDVYLDKSAQIITVMNDEGSLTVQFVCKKKAAQVLKECREFMKANNWKGGDSHFEIESFQPQFTKENKTADFFMEEDNGETTVSLSVTG